MRRRNLIILATAAAVLFGYYRFVELPRQQRRIERQEDARRLARFDPPNVARLHLYRGDGLVAFEIAGTHWQMTSPISDTADQTAVNRLIAAVAQARIHRTLKNAGDPASFGLDDPAVDMFFITDAGDTLLALSVGNLTIDKAFAYAHRGDDVLLVPTGVRRYALLPLEDFRNKRVVNFDLPGVEAFTVDSGASVLRWTRGDDGRWYHVDSDTVAGDRTAVEAILRRLRGLRVRAFPDVESTEIDTTKADFVEIRTKKGTTQRVYFTTRGDRTLARVSNERRIVEVDSTALRVFGHRLGDLRDRRLLHFDRESARRVTISSRDTTLTLVYNGEAWGPVNPSLPRLPNERVARVMKNVESLRFERVVDDKGADPATPASFQLAIYGSDDTILDELWCRPVRGDSLHVLATSRSSRLPSLVDADAIRALERQFSNLRPRR